jgi:signal transduction histidine kinase
LAVAAVVMDHRYRASHGAVVTNLAVDLGAASDRSLRDIVAAALGDPSMVLGLPGATGFTDEAGRPVAVDGASGRVWTDLFDGDHRIAVLQHDPALLRDRRLLDSVTALATVAVANMRLQQQVAASIVEVDASRRRLLAVGDAERSRLERELQASVLSRLARVAALVGALGLSDLGLQVDAARETIRSFAQCVYPRALDEKGLTALCDLEQFAGWVTFDVPGARFPRDIEAAAYFLCVEALTNVVKYAHATAANVSVSTAGGMLVVEVTDDGIGGAEPTQGTGLLGLRDRLEVLGGSLTVESPATGTRVIGHIPVVSD